MRSTLETDGSSSTRTHQARRKDILAAAITVINRDGYALSSIQKIAEEAKTSKSTVLYHFKSKAAIEQALVGTIFEEGAAYMGPFITAAQNYRDRLIAYIVSNLRFITQHTAKIAALHEIERNVGRERYTNSSARMQNDLPITWLRDMLIAGQKAHEFSIFDPTVMATTIRLVIDSSSHYILTHPELDLTQYISEIVNLFDRTTTRVTQVKNHNSFKRFNRRKVHESTK